ncbi:metal ion transporter, metal ion transporter family, partial [Opisthorchis viverrini]
YAFLSSPKGIFLGCEFGIACLYIWAVGILAAGQSSTMTGTYSGQFVMEGFINIKWKRWQRVLVTRAIAILPTLLVTVFRGIQDLTGMNDFLNVLMSIQLPFAIIPLLTFTSSKSIMNEFSNSTFTLVVANILSVVVVATNLFLASVVVHARLPKFWAVYLGITLLVLAYVCFVGYLWQALPPADSSFSIGSSRDSVLELAVTPPSSPHRNGVMSRESKDSGVSNIQKVEI